VGATLYSLTVSHPSQAALAMLRHKQIEPDVVELPPGAHAAVLLGLGFRRGTVPALKLDGRRIQGSLPIARELEASRPDPPLYPADPGERRRVEEAERWGESQYQPVPRRLFRWQTTQSLDSRRWLMRATGIPVADVAGIAIWPMTLLFARLEGVGEKEAKADFDAVPSLVDHVDGLIAEGTLDGEHLNAADFQIGTTTRVLLGFPELVPMIEARPAGAHARRVLPEHPGPVPAAIPPAWL